MITRKKHRTNKNQFISQQAREWGLAVAWREGVEFENKPKNKIIYDTIKSLFSDVEPQSLVGLYREHGKSVKFPGGVRRARDNQREVNKIKRQSGDVKVFSESEKSTYMSSLIHHGCH